MAKLCPRGKAAAKRKFKVYPSAYANMYASAVCSGKVTPGGKNKSQQRKERSSYKQAGVEPLANIARPCPLNAISPILIHFSFFSFNSSTLSSTY